MIANIITIHAMHNPGSVFQAYALQQYLSKTCEANIIDYRPSYFYSENSKVKLFLKKCLYYKAYISRSRKFDNFIQNNLRMTRTCKTNHELCKSNIEGDVFISGSDQLWNTDFPCGNDSSFYLDFVTNKKKISYATSVGKRIIDRKNQDILGHNLTDFQYLSVREKSTACLLTELLHREVRWVCDPVFLLNASDYMRFIDESSPISKPYAMIYMAGSSEILDKVVEFFKRKNLKIVLVGGFTKRCKCDVHIKDAGPEDFLNYIAHAEYVASCSFHATAFCHILHKQFITLLPDNNGERIESLLSLTGMSSRGISDKIDFCELDKQIDWNYVDEQLETYISNSKKYLDDALR